MEKENDKPNLQLPEEEHLLPMEEYTQPKLPNWVGDENSGLTEEEVEELMRLREEESEDEFRLDE